MNQEKIILDLCGGTGSWSRPYKEAGYEVFNLTLPDYDVTQPQKFPSKVLEAINDGLVYGILAAPPCTMFSDARTNAKTPRDLEGGMKVVTACLNIIYACQYKTKSDQQKYSPLKFWALENPWYGRLKWFLGNPIFTFSPWEFGDNYKKKTAIWGYFNSPIKTVSEIRQSMTEEEEACKTNSRKLPKFDYMKSKDIHPEYYKRFDRQTRRSITPQGFAYQFFKANQ